MRVKNEPLPESNRLRTPRESMQAQSRRNAAINQLSKTVRHRHETMRRTPRIATTRNFWGIVTECARTSATIKVRKATGTIGSLTVINEESEEITVWVGPYHHLCLDDEVFCWRNPTGISPGYTADLRVLGICYTEPDTEDLCEDQDAGGGVDNSCCEVEE